MSSHALFISLFVGYFMVLLLLAAWAGRRADSDGFFIGNRQSNWMLVAFGMVGTALSGVTFISVPGTVGTAGFTYMQVVAGNVIGYALVAIVLLPLYYRLKLTSIYVYLDERFGITAHRTGAWLFIVSRVLGSTARLYLVVNVIDILVTGPAGIPFWVSAAVTLLMIWGYTFQGGVRTIVITDTLQTTFMLGGLVICMIWLAGMIAPDGGAWSQVFSGEESRFFNTDPLSAGFWLKQILGGAAIAVAMLGLDQDMMQKNISVPNARDSQKNMAVFSAILIIVNLGFLVLGGFLWLFAQQQGIDARGDALFPHVVMNHLPQWLQIVFFIALIAASFSSADGSLTALTSSYCIDIRRLDRHPELDEAERRRIRLRAHVVFALIFFLLCLVFKWLDNRSIINTILVLAGYTYGPLLGLFCFGLFTRRGIASGASLALAVSAAPALCYLLQKWLAANPAGYQIGLELMILNAALTWLMLWVTSKPGSGRTV